MGKILEAAMRFFKEEGWLFTQAEGQPVLQIGFKGKNGTWNCYVQTREEQEQFIFYSVCPVNVPVAKRMAIVDFLNQANYSLAVGNFEMDVEDGEIRLRTSIGVGGELLNQALIRQLVYTNLTILDLYLPDIMSVIYGNVSPAEAITAIENVQSVQPAGAPER